MGDDLVAINNHLVKDVLDFRFHVASEDVELQVVRGGEETIYEVEKDHEDDLGLQFEELEIRFCGNDCPFCFVDQNPSGMRSSLYFRDEDFRLSFLSGHYVTLTNLSRRDMDRIVEQQLSPLFVSVHATDPEVRRFLFGISHDDRLLEKLTFLTQRGIEIHTQVVLCPEVNDGTVFHRTVSELADFRPHLRSVSVVPLGLTGHRQGLTKLKSVTPAYAAECIDTVDRYADEYKTDSQEHFVYASDEFYLMAGRPLPPVGRYDGFYQIENGVGMVRFMLDEFEKSARSFPDKLELPQKAIIVTAALAAPVLRDAILPRLNQVENFEAELVVVENEFYGKSIHVTGLLTGQDIYRQLRDRDLGDKVFLPHSCVKDDHLFLDDWTVAQISERLGKPVEPLHDFATVFQGSENERCLYQ